MTVVKASRNIPQSAFENQKTITSVFFGSKCSYVGQNAFNGCESLSKINNDNEIIEICDGTFAGTALYTVKLNKLSKIKEGNGVGAFKDCEKLKEVNIPYCVNIPSNTFENCTNLSSIDAENCEDVGRGAFYGCINLSSVNINKKYAGVNIHQMAFYNCSSLSDINLKACISIGSSAFYSCGKLLEANLENCKNIYQNAFCNCSSLKEITLSNSNIGNSAFYDCNKLSIVYVNTQDVIPLGSSVFYSGDSIIKNIKFYMQPGAISKFTEDKEYGWLEYLNNMIETPNSNQIIYTTNDGYQINVDIDGVEHVFENNFGKITFEEVEIVKRLPESKIFKGKETLTSIYLPYMLETVGEQEFEGCTSLDNFNPPQANTLKTIGSYAFKNCSSLKSFKIPESVTSIGEGVFSGCSNMEKFEGKYVKYNNKAIVYNNILISVAQKDDSEKGGRYYEISKIDSNIKILGESCFYGFKELIRVDIPSNIEKIGENAFDGCDNLQEVHFDGDPSKIEFGKNAFGIFKTDENGDYIIDENGDYIIKIGREDFKIFIPESIFRNVNFGSDSDSISDPFINIYGNYIYPEPAEKQIIYYLNSSENKKDYYIGNFNNKFSFKDDKKDISKVIFGNGITKINDFTFKNFTSLEYIYLPDTITTFGNECFYGCSSLKRIRIPNKPDYFYSKNEIIKDSVTDSIIPMSDVEIENNLNDKLLNNKFGTTSFGDNLFYGCVNLMKFDSYYKKFVSNDGRCYIDGETLMFFAQGDRDGIYEMPTEINILKINKSAFKGSNIPGIVISSNVSTIGESAFEGCSKLTSITFNNVSNISKCAFKGCENLGVISLPLLLKTIGESAFEGCEKMSIDENLSDSLSEIGNKAFMNCKKFKCVINNTDTPLNLSNIISIGDYAFSGCESLSTELILPSTLTSIGKCCFQHSGITGLDMSKSNKINTIPYNTFYDCTNLKNVILPDSIEYIQHSVFEDCNSLDKIDLPLNLSKIGNNSFATNVSNNRHININTKTPPKFVNINGIEITNGSILPFGKNIAGLNIFVPAYLYNTYKNDIHWGKYAKIIRILK